MNIQELISRYDTSGYCGVLSEFDMQIHEAAGILRAFIEYSDYLKLRERGPSLRQIVICGMGGSAIAGDFVKYLFSDRLPVPVIVCRDYEAPHFVTDETLVIASSYSGSTEETVSALQDAISRKAAVLSLSTGGIIAESAVQNSFPNIYLPKGLQPRQAIGYSFTILAGIFHHLFFHSLPENDFSEAIAYIRRKKADLADTSETNSLFETAAGMAHQPVMIYASEPMFAAALRLKGQISENAKLLAFANTIVEMNHNEIVGWQTIESDSINNFSIILLRDAEDHPQVQKRFDIIHDLLGKKSQVYVFRSEGRSKFTRFISLIYLGDWLSYYLALARGQDPTPVDIIGYLKKRLAENA